MRLTSLKKLYKKVFQRKKYLLVSLIAYFLYIVILWSPFILSRNLDEVFIYNHTALTYI